jgi:hypothetical protein
MTKSKHKFFFSYSTKDSHRVQEIRAALEGRGQSVWIDSADIGAGDAIASKIDDALGDSEHFVLFISTSWMQSNWTKAEFDAAFYLTRYSSRQKIFVVRLDETPLQPFLASRRAIVFTSAAQVTEELITATASPGEKAREGDWQTLPWDAIEDRYLTSLAGQIMANRPSNTLVVPLGDKILRMNLVAAVASDPIIVTDLIAELKIYQTLVDVISSYRVELIEDALGKFKPGFESALKRKSLELDQCRARLRQTLQALSPRLWVRPQLQEQPL